MVPFLAAAQTTPKVHPHSPEDLKEAAARYERAGQHRLAALAYEQLMKVDPSSRILVRRHLVSVYTKAKQPEKALRLAESIMDDMPDPEAYLARVHSQLGNADTAAKILEGAIADTEEPTRLSRLQHQLAALQKKTSPGKPESEATR